MSISTQQTPRLNLAAKGSQAVAATGAGKSFTAQAAIIEAGSWGGSVLTMKYSNDGKTWANHPNGDTLSADGITTPRSCNCGAWVCLEVTSAASASAFAQVTFAMSDVMVDSSVPASTTAQQDAACLYPVLPDDGGRTGILAVSGTAYFVYMGKTITALTPRFVEYMVSVIGAGAQTMEIGLFSTPLAPNAGSQSVTKLVATGTCTSVTSTGTKSNTSAFTISIAAGTHLWTGVRWAMATTQPTVQSAVMCDFGLGAVLTTAASGVLTGSGPWTGAVPASTLAASLAAPLMRVRI